LSGIVKSVGKAYFRALGYYPTRIHGHRFRVDPYNIGFWRAAAQGRWEPHTFRILSTFLGRESVYCDLGAWIGPTVLYAGKIARKVVCFEPDPRAYRFLAWNLELNGLTNVTSFSIALSGQTGLGKMSSFGGALGDSSTSLLGQSSQSETVDVLTHTWDVFAPLFRSSRLDFIKIDIEGGEFSLLPSLAEYLSAEKPIVYLSTHAPFLDPSVRRERMQEIADVLGVYSKCLNQDLEPADRRTWAEDSTGAFRSFVFLD